jgi:hypothetical protein
MVQRKARNRREIEGLGDGVRREGHGKLSHCGKWFHQENDAENGRDHD